MGTGTKYGHNLNIEVTTRTNMTLFPEEPDVHICFNCDSEFTITPITEEIEEVIFCCYCGAELYDEEDEDDEEEDK